MKKLRISLTFKKNFYILFNLFLDKNYFKKILRSSWK